VPELGSLGTVRGALGNGRPYRELPRKADGSITGARPPASQQKWRLKLCTEPPNQRKLTVISQLAGNLGPRRMRS
jgi:hypothetical protein